MAKRLFPTPETIAALASLLGLDSLNSVRTIKISFKSGEPVTVDLEMFIWDHDRLTSVVEQLTADIERETNVKIEVTPKLLEQVDVQSLTDPEPVYVARLNSTFDHFPVVSPDMTCLAHDTHPHAGLSRPQTLTSLGESSSV